MIFSELVDLVELAVNGGEFSSESAVQQPDIESYVPVAAHAVIRNAVFGLKADSRAERSVNGSTSSVIDPAFFETYEVDVAFDNDRKMHYADLPAVVQSWPNDAGLNAVFAKQRPDVLFTKLNGVKDYSAMSRIISAISAYWHEKAEPSGTKVSRLWLPSANDGVCNMMVIAALEIGPDLGDSRLPLPSGLEALVCQACVEHFRGQRSMPADALITNKDVNAEMAQTT